MSQTGNFINKQIKSIRNVFRKSKDIPSTMKQHLPTTICETNPPDTRHTLDANVLRLAPARP